MFSGLFNPFLSMIKSKKKIPVFQCKRNGGKSINKIHLVCIWKKMFNINGFLVIHSKLCIKFIFLVLQILKSIFFDSFPCLLIYKYRCVSVLIL